MRPRHTCSPDKIVPLGKGLFRGKWRLDMSQSANIDVLNRLLTLLRRSFPMYLTYAEPWVGPGDKQMLEVLEHIVFDQNLLAERVSGFIMMDGTQPQTGDFPMDYTDTHDLQLDYLLRLAINYQKQDIEAMRQCVDDLRLAPLASTLAEEALGMAQGQLESLEELVAQPA